MISDKPDYTPHYKPLFTEVTADHERFKYIKKHFDNLVGQKQEKERLLEESVEKKEELEERHDSATKARALVQDVAQQTQQKLEYHIASLVNLALSSIFDDPYEFEVEFVQRRNKTETDLWFVKDGERMKPIDSSGGGALDVASFALRCAFWSLRKTRPTIVLDEPMKFLSRDLQPKASEMVRHLSESLGLQFLITSHINELIEAADKLFNVIIRGGVSSVEEI